MRHLPLLSWIALAGCPALGHGDVRRLSDQDGDGYAGEAWGGPDCDDRDPAVHPDAGEACNGLDDDCDGLWNEEDDDLVGVDWYRDADGDGFGDPDSHLRTCQALGGLPGDPWIAVGPGEPFDCDDQDSDAFPGQVWRFDGDGDGFAVCSAPTRSQCLPPEGHVVDRLPADRAACEAAVEEDEAVRAVADCDDRDPAVSPGFPETCNGRDDDCDGAIDDDDDDLLGAVTSFPDEDGDGFGADPGVTRCAVRAGYVEIGGDCNDDPGDPDAPNQKPGALDPAYDGVDSNCDGADDYDFDRDGARSVAYGGDDCDDFAVWIHPGADEICDGEDSDCDGSAAPAQERGAFFVAAPGDAALLLRGYTDLQAALTDGDTVYLSGEGTVWLCDDQEWTGQIQAFVGGAVTVRSPEGHPATLRPPPFGGIALTLEGQVVTVRDLVVEGAVALTSNDPASEVSGVTIETADYSTPLIVSGPITVQGAAVTGMFGSLFTVRTGLHLIGSRLTSALGQPLIVSGGGGVPVTIEDSELLGPVATTLSGLDVATLTAVTLGGVPGLSTQFVGRVDGTAVTFADPDTQVLWRGSTYGFGVTGPLDFVCTGAACTSP